MYVGLDGGKATSGFALMVFVLDGVDDALASFVVVFVASGCLFSSSSCLVDLFFRKFYRIFVKIHEIKKELSENA